MHLSFWYNFDVFFLVRGVFYDAYYLVAAAEEAAWRALVSVSKISILQTFITSTSASLSRAYIFFFLKKKGWVRFWGLTLIKS